MFVSVVVPVYNGERYVGEAIESVLRQSHRDFELLLINDGSHDSSLEILRKYEQQDPRVRVIAHANWGMGRALNHAIELAQSDWIARFDADDVMEPNRLERQIAFIHENPSVAVCSSLVTYIDDHGNAFGRSQSELTDDAALAARRTRDELIALYHPSVLMRRRAFLNIGGYRPEFWPCDDLDLWTRLADQKHRILVQQEHLVRYRRHEGSVTVYEARKVEMHLSWVEQCSRNRRQGLPEPSFDEFLAVRRSLPLVPRLNENRKALANVLLKQAVLSYCRSRYVKSTIQVIGSTLLDPTSAPKRVWQKLLRSKLGSFSSGKREVARP